MDFSSVVIFRLFFSPYFLYNKNSYYFFYFYLIFSLYVKIKYKNSLVTTPKIS